MELIAPAIGGITTSDGERIAAHHAVAGGPSVLFDAVAVLPSEDGAVQLAADPHARDFVSDAYAHAKFIGHNAAADKLFEAVGLHESMLDDGCIEPDARTTAGFVEARRALRYWAGELALQPA